jgi:CRP/FNR family cyclic AMP-dependent transcriptional regulator
MARATVDAELLALGHISIFESLNEEDLGGVARAAWLLKLKPEHVLVSPTCDAGATYFLLEGRVKLFHMSKQGREVTVQILQAGDVFGDFSEDERDGQQLWAETIEPSRVAVMPTDHFSGLLRRHPSVALRLVGEMSTRLSRRAEQIEDLALRDVPGRVASTLLKLAEEHGTMGSRGMTISLRLTHQDIADMAAAGRETVTAVLARLRRDGTIDIENKRVRIVHPERLGVRVRDE